MERGPELAVEEDALRIDLRRWNRERDLVEITVHAAPAPRRRARLVARDRIEPRYHRPPRHEARRGGEHPQHGRLRHVVLRGRRAYAGEADGERMKRAKER